MRSFVKLVAITQQNGEHSVTVPYHNPLRVGTLSAILADVANHVSLTKDDLMQRLFAE